MNLLAIDTSTSQTSIALNKDGEIFERTIEEEKLHAKIILPTINELLCKANCKLSSIDGLIFGRGPGSFTGLRIGCSVVKGLGFAQDLPLFPVSNLALLAYQAFEVYKEMVYTGVLVMIDAKINQVYWAYFSKTQDLTEHTFLKEYMNLASDIHFNELMVDKDSMIVVGLNYEDYLCNLPLHIKKSIVFHKTLYPSAVTMIKYVLTMKPRAESLDEGLPIYISSPV